MRLTSVCIRNLLSYEEARFELKGYNVIVGPNDSGKTNLLRILRTFRDVFVGSPLPDGFRSGTDGHSHLALGITASCDELRMLLQSLAFRRIKGGPFPDRLGEIRLFASWNGPAGGNGRPAVAQVYLDGGLGAAFDNDSTILFNTSSSGTTPDEMFSRTRLHDLSGIYDFLGSCNIPHLGRYNATSTFDDGGREDRIERLITERYSKYFATPEREGIEGEIKEYSGEDADCYKNNATMMVIRSMMGCIVTSSEMRPSHGDLEGYLQALKDGNFDGYGLMKKEFSGMFAGTEAESREEDRGKTRTVIRSSDGEFRFEDTASGHHSALYTLRLAADSPGAVILLDEPEEHLHPAMARRLAGRLEKMSSDGGGQIILLTHSPELVDSRMLDPESGRRLIRVASNGGASEAHFLTPDAGPLPRRHRLDPRMMFGRASLLAVGPGDVLLARAVSGACGGILESHSVTIVDCGGDSGVMKQAGLHKIFGIPCVAMADGDCGGCGRVGRLGAGLEADMGTAGVTPEGARAFVRKLLEDGGGRGKLKGTSAWKAVAAAVEAAGGDPDRELERLR